MKGRIVRALAGFYYVETEKGVFQCRARGNFKKEDISPLVGDVVEMEITHEVDSEGVINEIEIRKNEFIRPAVSNVDVMVVMMAATKPEPNLHVLDKFLVSSEVENVTPIVCINKVDIAEKEKLEKIKQIYDGIYETHYISCKTGEGVKELEETIGDKLAALAGPSGVGKSTLLNLLQDAKKAETGGLSHKTGRGKHTTRHVEMFHTKLGGSIFDTPGFTSLDARDDIDENDLQLYYPEIRAYRGDCKFDNCKHIKEPGCKVKDALDEGSIKKSRYDSYLSQLEEIANKKEY